MIVQGSHKDQQSRTRPGGFAAWPCSTLLIKVACQIPHSELVSVGPIEKVFLCFLKGLSQANFEDQVLKYIWIVDDGCLSFSQARHLSIVKTFLSDSEKRLAQSF